jgi:hypothetical protein
MRTGTLAFSKKHTSTAISVASLVIGLLILQNIATAEAQAQTSFTPYDRFGVPSLNGEISFSTNGTFANATLINGAWNFADLRLNGSTPLEMLTASAQSSNITIASYRGPNTAFNITFRSARLRYEAEGQGQQTFNIGIPAGDGRWGLHPEWSVIVNNEWLGEGDGWSITPDGNVTVTGAVGNVSIIHYGFLGLDDDSSDLTFYEQHSVAIITILSVAATAVVATLMMTRNKSAKLTEKAATLLD